MLDSFAGKLTLQDGTVVDAVLTIADDTLAVTFDTIEVGTWPLKYCRVSRRSENEFELSIDGEKTVFHPVDHYSFGKFAAERFYGSSIADRINVIRSMPVTRDDDGGTHAAGPPRLPREPFSIPRIPWAVTGAVVAAAALIAVGGWAVAERTTAEEAARTTVRSTVTTPVNEDLFTLTPEGFRQRWNTIAVATEPRLLLGERFGTGRFEVDLSEEVVLTGSVDGDGTVDTIKVSIRPTTSPEETAFALASMAVAMSIADPTLTASDGTMIMQRLGLTGFPDDLTLAGIDGEVIENGIRYWLLFIDLDGTVTDLLAFGVTRAQ